MSAVDCHGSLHYLNLSLCPLSRSQKEEAAAKSQDGPIAKKHAGDKTLLDKKKLDKKKSLKRL